MKHLFAGAAVGVLSILAAGDALAQTSQRSGTATIEELVVTAQRREQAAQDVGIALSVIDASSLQSQGIANINQLQNATPNLEIEAAFGGGTPQFRLRGVGFQDYAANNSPTVGMYVNEVAYPIPVMTQGLLFDMQRVEVLRGPQGTLYGRNTTGGAINIVTGKPTATVAGGATVEFGRYEQLRAEAFVAGPIATFARGRLAFGTEQGGAFQYHRDYGTSVGDADRVGGRGMLELDLGEKAQVLFDVHGGYDKSENSPVYLFSPLATANGAGRRYPVDNRLASGWLISPTLARDTGLPRDSVPGRDNHTYGASANLNWDLGATRLVNIAAYDFQERREYGDWDATSSIEADTFFAGKAKVWSNELRLESNTDGKFHWLAGVYAAKQRQREQFYSDFTDIYATYARVLYSQLVKSISVFGQAEYAFTDQLKLTGGLRYEKETRSLEGFGSAFGGAQALPPTDVDTKMTPTTGKLALDYKPMDNLLIYASASKGVKSGGFTTYNTGNSSAIQPFLPEKLYAYELGFKSDPTNYLQFNAAVYYYDYRDRQVLTAVYGANGPVGRIANAPKTKIWGAEVEMTWKPVAGLLITQGASYKDGEYKEFNDLDVPASRAAGRAIFIDRAGQKLPFNNWSYTGSISYTAPVGDDLSLTTDFNYSYRDKYPSWLGVKYDIPGYWLANANVSLSPNEGPWEAAIYLRNVFNEKYDLTRNFFTSADIAQPGRPRTYGVRLSYRY